MIVSEWLGGFGIDEGMLVPVIVARDRWLKPGGVMIPRLVMAWAALVHDRYLAEMVEFLRGSPYGLRFDDLVEKTVNEIFYSGTFRHLAARDKRSEASRRGRPTHTSSRFSRRRRLTKPRRCSPSATTERPTRLHCGSAPSSRPASRCLWDPAIRPRIGG